MPRLLPLHKSLPGERHKNGKRAGYGDFPKIVFHAVLVYLNVHKMQKLILKNTEEVIDFLSGKQQVIISVAPSFASVYNKWERKRLPSALRQAGFSLVAETAIGAYEVALKTREIIENKPDTSHICTACPAVVNYIEKYSKNEIRFLTPVVSPMVAHARMLKKQYGAEAKVVFVGPCVAKKSEALHPKHQNIVDAVITFDELNEILKQKKIDLKTCEESDFDQKSVWHVKIVSN
jgi:iron only hydrogenase large subunit-like protein